MTGFIAVACRPRYRAAMEKLKRSIGPEAWLNPADRDELSFLRRLLVKLDWSESYDLINFLQEHTFADRKVVVGLRKEPKIRTHLEKRLQALRYSSGSRPGGLGSRVGLLRFLARLVFAFLGRPARLPRPAAATARFAERLAQYSEEPLLGFSVLRLQSAARCLECWTSAPSARAA